MCAHVLGSCVPCNCVYMHAHARIVYRALVYTWLITTLTVWAAGGGGDGDGDGDAAAGGDGDGDGDAKSRCECPFTYFALCALICLRVWMSVASANMCMLLCVQDAHVCAL
jgi:hypothetical protein